MTEQDQTTLRATVAKVAANVRRNRDRQIGEQNTKATLIEPVLEALGWDIRDFDEVTREFKAKPRDKPVDYALKLFRKPRLFIEAKGLGENLADRRWVSQVLSYATVAGVQWCVLTDGNEYRFYNATATVDAEEKLFRSVIISDSDESEVAILLDLISRRNLEENQLNVLWSVHFVDRSVKSRLRAMLDSQDKGLVRLIRKTEPQLAPKEIAESLSRLVIAIDSPALTGPMPSAHQVKSLASKAKQAKPLKLRKQKGRTEYGVSLSDVLASGVLTAPLKLFRRYKGTDFEAKLQSDGKVQFQGVEYDSCSTAAENARSTITGRKMNTNGWSFWQYRDGAGAKRELLFARKQLLNRR